MKRVCFTMQIKKELMEEYLENHHVWPEMQEAIKNSGINNYSLFINEQGVIVGYFEAEDPQQSLEKLGQTEINKKW